MNYFYIYAIIYPNSNKKPKNIWYFAHFFVSLQQVSDSCLSGDTGMTFVGKI